MTALVLSLDPAMPLVSGGAANLIALATLARIAGADGLRVTVNEELSPLGESELRDLRRTGMALELCIAPAPGLVKVALEAQPERVILASTRSSGDRSIPLDFETWGQALGPAIRSLRDGGSRVLALGRGTPQSVKAAHSLGFDGVELLTGPALESARHTDGNELDSLRDAGQLAAKLGLELSLAGGLGYDNLAESLRALPLASRCCVGRAFIERTILVGAERAVRDLRARLP